MNKRATFQSRTQVDDGYGNKVGAWPGEQGVPDGYDFIRWCNVRYLRGGESVMASRLQGRQPVIVTVRKDPSTDTITPDMRCLIAGRAYNIREFPRPSDNRLYLEFMAESGVAQ
ncbi:phage head closure protein [Paracoccus methylarcula]|uniref:phage head closure protein n=1 Tax=Paracoccus methylarcula TaxID=72022 RepID=UPI001B868C75|nr:phage head closure protein [Paracoccus methylarcula]